MDMNLRSFDGHPSPYDLIYGKASATGQPGEEELPSPGAGPVSGNGASSSSSVSAGDAVEEWGSICSRPISWGRLDPPSHPDAGIEWSNTCPCSPCRLESQDELRVSTSQGANLGFVL
jgi:hypothetical protein